MEREAESIEERKRGSLSRNGNASEITQKVHKDGRTDGKDEWVWQKGSLAFTHTAPCNLIAGCRGSLLFAFQKSPLSHNTNMNELEKKRNWKSKLE